MLKEALECSKKEPVAYSPLFVLLKRMHSSQTLDENEVPWMDQILALSTTDNDAATATTTRPGPAANVAAAPNDVAAE